MSSPSSELAQRAAILYLNFPFYLKGHQLQAADKWMSTGMRGSIIYSSGTGKTEIAFECARRAAAAAAAVKPAVFTTSNPKTEEQSMFRKKITRFNILLVVPRIV